jgi:hypothetical protein
MNSMSKNPSRKVSMSQVSRNIQNKNLKGDNLPDLSQIPLGIMNSIHYQSRPQS